MRLVRRWRISACGRRDASVSVFLVAPGVARRIVDVADVRGTRVVEIGPGLGALYGCAGRGGVRARPRGDRSAVGGSLAGALRRRGPLTCAWSMGMPSKSISRASWTATTAPSRSATSRTAWGPRSSSACSKRAAHFARLVLMLQREVAERIVASPGTKPYGTLSVWTALHGDARIAFRVSSGAFVPRPKVDSAVVTIALLREPRVPSPTRNDFATSFAAPSGNGERRCAGRSHAWPPRARSRQRASIRGGAEKLSPSTSSPRSRISWRRRIPSACPSYPRSRRFGAASSEGCAAHASRAC